MSWKQKGGGQYCDFNVGYEALWMLQLEYHWENKCNVGMCRHLFWQHAEAFLEFLKDQSFPIHVDKDFPLPTRRSSGHLLHEKWGVAHTQDGQTPPRVGCVNTEFPFPFPFPLHPSTLAISMSVTLIGRLPILCFQ